jgi:hypothetical protein
LNSPVDSADISPANSNCALAGVFGTPHIRPCSADPADGTATRLVGSDGVSLWPRERNGKSDQGSPRKADDGVA